MILQQEPEKNDPTRIRPGVNDPGKIDPTRIDPDTNDPRKNDPTRINPGTNDPGKIDPTHVPGPPSPIKPVTPSPATIQLLSFIIKNYN